MYRWITRLALESSRNDIIRFITIIQIETRAHSTVTDSYNAETTITGLKVCLRAKDITPFLKDNDHTYT